MTTYTATFGPEAWINDNAVPVDPQGPTTWDCTEAVTSNPKYWETQAAKQGDWASEVVDNDDLLKHDPAAPQWVRDWSGPFTITVTRSEPQVAITGYVDSGGEMSCNVYTVVVDGTTYKVERWATHNASGTEWITEDGKNVEPPLGLDETFDDLAGEFDTAFYVRWREQVEPVIQRITAEALAEVAAKQKEQQ